MTMRSIPPKPLHDYGPWLAELAAREAASMAHMTDSDVQYWIDRLALEISEPNYSIKVHSSVSEKAKADLAMYRRELERRSLATLNAATQTFCDGLMARYAPLQAAE